MALDILPLQTSDSGSESIEIVKRGRSYDMVHGGFRRSNVGEDREDQSISEGLKYNNLQVVPDVPNFLQRDHTVQCLICNPDACTSEGNFPTPHHSKAEVHEVVTVRQLVCSPCNSLVLSE